MFEPPQGSTDIMMGVRTLSLPGLPGLRGCIPCPSCAAGSVPSSSRPPRLHRHRLPLSFGRKRREGWGGGGRWGDPLYHRAKLESPCKTGRRDWYRHDFRPSNIPKKRERGRKKLLSYKCNSSLRISLERILCETFC